MSESSPQTFATWDNSFRFSFGYEKKRPASKQQKVINSGSLKFSATVSSNIKPTGGTAGSPRLAILTRREQLTLLFVKHLGLKAAIF